MNLIKPPVCDREALPELAPDAIITTVGQNQMWAAQFFVHKDPGVHILRRPGDDDAVPGGHRRQDGPARCTVIDVADGSFLMNSQELAAAVVSDIPVKVAV